MQPKFRSIVWSTLIVSGLILATWCFPSFWYTRNQSDLGRFWMSERTNLPGWSSREIPVDKSAEAVLVADHLVSAEFTGPDGRIARVFSAKRYVESPNEIGLFVHTPDRCWTQSGWEIEPAQPECRRLPVHGVPLLFERRIFRSGQQRELVYFAGLVAGQPLPYRLDHNLSVGMKHALRRLKDQTDTRLRVSDKRLWEWVWEAFLSRRPLIGPKQFVRVSTPISESDIALADAFLESFLQKWLELAPYEHELHQWEKRAPSNRGPGSGESFTRPLPKAPLAEQAFGKEITR